MCEQLLCKVCIKGMRTVGATDYTKQTSHSISDGQKCSTRLKNEKLFFLCAKQEEHTFNV